jgi:DNA (cytosine-5)-methyltransferase 1
VALSSTPKNPYAWNLADLASVPSVGVKVMSTFACGGGSSMGYKRAGCEVIAANDIDPEMAWHYKRNINPRHYFLCPIRDLLTAKLPDELFGIDILDGSPPCSTFSMAGSREKAWGKKKHFREGQSEQVLSDLFFDYLDLVGHLRPKVAIAENVKGMILGNAQGYTRMVMARFKELGYRAQLFLLNAADCGVPQRRERVFFCALRNDINAPLLKLAPRHPWVSAGEACDDLAVLTKEEAGEVAATEMHLQWWHLTKKGDSYGTAAKAAGRTGLFSHVRLNDMQPAPTLTCATGDHSALHWDECRRLTYREWKRLGSFPDDYVAKSPKIGKYMIGMSVPPKMTEAVARAVVSQWLKPDDS